MLASTTSLDGTTFTLARRSDLNWYLRLSNANWQLPTRHRYAMVAQVDYYPRLRIAAVAKSKTSLEIADLDKTHLLDLVENGHFIELTSDEFHAKYILEGSAKIIQRLRNCMPASERLKGRGDP